MLKAGSVFFITGAASGIGAATAELVASKGHRVAVCDLNLEAASVLAKRLGENAHPIAIEVREAGAWESALDEAWKRFGGIDVLVNNAGVIHTGWVREQPFDKLQHMIDVNLIGLMRGVLATVPRFQDQGHGHVINVGSLASFVPLPGQTVYAATKHAVRAFHHGFAMEQRDRRVTFTLVCPGVVDTPMLRQQYGIDASALSFSSPAMQPGEVAEAILRAARERPLEILIPAFQGAQLRLAGIFPRIVRLMKAGAEARGRKAMSKLPGGTRE
ncbi:MAG: SDR family oxidoreductase [Deltaproteobacteria bacterium]|nr:SDR family oxidoreductase [Deltaproteobacteria bacterium]